MSELAQLLDDIQEIAWSICTLGPGSDELRQIWMNQRPVTTDISKKLINHNDANIQLLREKLNEMRQVLTDKGMIKA